MTSFGTLVLPASCVVCGAWDASLCPGCLARFRSATTRPFRAEAGAESLPDVELPPAGSRSGRSGRSVGAGRSAHETFGPLPVVAAGRYGSAVAGVLLAYKNHGHVDLAAPVAAALNGALHAAVPVARDQPGAASTGRDVLLVPVPTRASSRRRRGYDPVLLLLARLRRSASLPANTELATVVRHRPPLERMAQVLHGGRRVSARSVLTAVLSGGRGGQKGLGRRHRRANVLLSMRTRRRGSPAGRDCIIVDDVLTTGATINEVHRVLVTSGARVLGAVVIAATAPPEGAARRSR